MITLEAVDLITFTHWLKLSSRTNKYSPAGIGPSKVKSQVLAWSLRNPGCFNWWSDNLLCHKLIPIPILALPFSVFINTRPANLRALSLRHFYYPQVALMWKLQNTLPQDFRDHDSCVMHDDLTNKVSSSRTHTQSSLPTHKETSQCLQLLILC